MSKHLSLFFLLISGTVLACNIGTAFPGAFPTSLPTEGINPTPPMAIVSPTLPTSRPDAGGPGPSETPTPLTPIVSPTVSTEVPEQGGPAATATPALETSQPLLEWEGFGVWGDGDDTRCKMLQIDSAQNLEVGFCEGTASESQPAGEQFEEMVNKFAPFEYITANERLVFRGGGQLDSPAWQRALAAWAHWTYAEVSSGYACTVCRTVLSWDFGQIPDQAGLCRHLTVLDYGYATVETLPCAGGEVTGYVGGWLEPAEWDTFDAWLYNLGAVFEGENYFAGMGVDPVTPGQADQIESWAKDVFDRLNIEGETGSGQGG